MSKSKMNKLGLDSSALRGLNSNKRNEDVTEDGEFISTFYCWMTLEEQKRNAEYLANIEKINKKYEEEERFKD